MLAASCPDGVTDRRRVGTCERVRISRSNGADDRARFARERKSPRDGPPRVFGSTSSTTTSASGA